MTWQKPIASLYHLWYLPKMCVQRENDKMILLFPSTSSCHSPKHNVRPSPHIQTTPSEAEQYRMSCSPVLCAQLIKSVSHISQSFCEKFHNSNYHSDFSATKKMCFDYHLDFFYAYELPL